MRARDEQMTADRDRRVGVDGCHVLRSGAGAPARLLDSVGGVAVGLGLDAVPDLGTGAGHDAGVLSSAVPTAMLFVRNPTGVSHSPEEFADARRLPCRYRGARRCDDRLGAHSCVGRGELTMTSWWCENAWLPPGRVASRVLITVADGRITGVDADVDPPSTAQRLAGLVIPGLANTHSHAFHRALRGRAQVGRGDFWTWRNQMYSVADRLDPETYLALARATYVEMALAGITCVGEFHYVHHQAGGVPYSDLECHGRCADRGGGTGRRPVDVA